MNDHEVIEAIQYATAGWIAGQLLVAFGVAAFFKWAKSRMAPENKP